MPKTVNVADLYPVIEEKLHTGGYVTMMASGVSMLPMLRNQLDTVILGPVTEPLLMNDVVLYRRANGQFVLHRIVGLETNGNYILCGDNQYILEHNISHQQVVGLLQSFTRKGRSISCTSHYYKAYVNLLPTLRFLHFGLSISRRYASVLKRKVRRWTNGRE